MFEFFILPNLRTTSIFQRFFLFLNVFEVVYGLLQIIITSLPVFYLSQSWFKNTIDSIIFDLEVTYLWFIVVKLVF